MASRRKAPKQIKGRARTGGPFLAPPPIERKHTVVDKKRDLHRVTYKMKVTKELRDDPEKVAAMLAARVHAIHGGGGKKYSDLHFAGVFTGIQYEEDDKQSSKMGRTTLGTYHNRSLKTVEEELASRIQALLEGRPAGAQSGSDGFFPAGIQEAAIVVMLKGEVPGEGENDDEEIEEN